jgi:hypothetical protein
MRRLARQEHDFWLGKILKIRPMSIPILWFVSTTANNCETNETRLGRNATRGFLTIIEGFRRSCRIILQRWRHFF